MEQPTNQDNIETSQSTVKQAAKEFAEAFAETQQFVAFEQAYYAYRQDELAQKALNEYQEKQMSLQAMLMLDSVSEEDKQELMRLRDQFFNQPSVLEYTKAQNDLVALSQEIGNLLSEAIGMDFGNACRTGGGCCG